MKIKKILLVASIALLILTVPFVSTMIEGESLCGCADTYMGATFVKEKCIIIENEMVFRSCWYEY